MATLTHILPRPKRTYQREPDALEEAGVPSEPVFSTGFVPPAYGHRQAFIPKSQEDFGGGGAYPEIHVTQYPLSMGQTRATKKTTLATAIDTTSGKIKYDAVLGHGKDKTVHSTIQAIIPKYDHDAHVKEIPDVDEVNKTTAATRAALEKLVEKKIAASTPAGQRKDGPAAPSYLRYQSAQQGTLFNSGAKSRVIRMVEVSEDPMEPPKFKHKKAPGGPPSPPAPVQHSPPRKLTVKDQQDWKIPPCISNWKNHKGYTIPLDKRLAADGRGLQDSQINDKFAKLSESLYIAERNARDEVEKRAQVQKRLAMKEKEKKEEELRNLAQKARAERAGRPAPGQGAPVTGANTAELENPREIPSRPLAAEMMEGGAPETDEARREREILRNERRRERQRELRMEAAGMEEDETGAAVRPGATGSRGGGHKSKGARDRDRDVSEKIALGQVKGGQSHETMYDQRLFNQSQGMDSGFGADDDYTVYSKPLFGGTASQSIYRPKQSEEDKDARSRPVEFEKDAEEKDPFGLDQLLSDAKGKEGENRKRARDVNEDDLDRDDRSRRRGRDERAGDRERDRRRDDYDDRRDDRDRDRRRR